MALKSKSFLLIAAAASIASVVAVGAVVNTSSLNIRGGDTLGENEYYHYSAVEATCEKAGIKEYWTNCTDTTLLTAPEGGVIKANRTPSEAEIADLIANHPTDERIVPALNHNFDDNTGECGHEVNQKLTTELIDTYVNHGTKGKATLVATEDPAPTGYDTIYQYTHAYNNDVAWTISNAFTDADISGYNSISFYINSADKEFMFAGDDGTQSTGYELHPNSAYGTAGIITCVNKGSGTWRISSSGFLFRNMNSGAAASSFTFHNRNTMNELFHRPSDGWGASTIKISEIHVEGVSKCGARNLLGSAVANPAKWTDAETCAGLGKIYNATGAVKYSALSYPLDGLTEIKFRVNNADTNNSFILKGSTSSCVGGIYGGRDEVVVATKVGTTWTVALESGRKFFTLPSWASQASYSVENPSNFSDLFYFYSDSSNLKISDIVAKGTPTVKRTKITTDAIDIHTNHGTLGTSTLTDSGTPLPGFGKKYAYKNTYNGTDTGLQIVSLFNEYDLTGVKEVDFYIYLDNGGELVFADDAGTADNAYELHGSAGANTPGVIRAVQGDVAGTWTVNACGFAFRSMADGSQKTSFTYTGRTTLRSLFTNPRSWGVSKLSISDVYVMR